MKTKFLQIAESIVEQEAFTIIFILRTTTYLRDEFTNNMPGASYQVIRSYVNDKKHYQLAVNTSPLKFYPFPLLTKLYNETGQVRKATTIAKEILNKEVKVPSTAIDEIKEEMQQLISDSASLQKSKKSEGKRQEACMRKKTAPCLCPSFTRKEVR